MGLIYCHLRLSRCAAIIRTGLVPSSFIFRTCLLTSKTMVMVAVSVPLHLRCFEDGTRQGKAMEHNEPFRRGLGHSSGEVAFDATEPEVAQRAFYEVHAFFFGYLRHLCSIAHLR